MEDAFWTFIDQKWKDSLNVAAAEPAGWDQGGTFNRWPGIAKKEEQDKPGIKKIPSAGIHVAVATGGQATSGRPTKKCKFADIMDCAGIHPPWQCRVFRDKTTEESDKIIKDNKLCPFCLLHDVDEICYSRVNKTKPVCKEIGCGGQHIKWLHEMLKET